MAPSIEDRAIAELCSTRFHRVFYLPADPARNRHNPLRVTYSDSGRHAAPTAEEEAELPTVFFCGGLMGGRWMLTIADALSRAKGVRVICIDRPGMGGTDAVPLEERIAVWLEIVPALLAHLNIRHISLASHSGGAIYALNLLLTHRHLLHPQTPHVAFFAPWIHQSHTDATVMAATDLFPRSWIAGMHNVVLFMVKNVVPSLGFSSGMVSKLLPADDKPVVGGSGGAADEEEAKLEKAKESVVMKYVFAEEVAGASDDALIIVRRTGYEQPWGAWGDFDTGLPLLAAQEAGRGPRTPESAVLKVHGFYAGKDRLTGSTGWKWFDGCWAEALKGSRGMVEFEGKVCEGTNHDSILDRKYGVWANWLDTIAASAAREDI